MVVMLKGKDFVRYSTREVFKDEYECQELDFELDILKFVFKGFEKIYQPGVLYRSCGTVLDVLTFSSKEQLTLFGDNGQKSEKLASAIDKLERLHGKNAVKVGFLD
ncbi:putative RumB/ImpB like DNA repair protein [Candidatus Gastranaerophilus sp. (ex Termes propinquus)]|nr:putative RumB/ImpB like DNA repair protein [Candidatus Gastranaerophilus sp. (ex Termes propinquus)]